MIVDDAIVATKGLTLYNEEYKYIPSLVCGFVELLESLTLDIGPLSLIRIKSGCSNVYTVNIE